MNIMIMTEDDDGSDDDDNGSDVNDMRVMAMDDILMHEECHL